MELIYEEDYNDEYDVYHQPPRHEVIVHETPHHTPETNQNETSINTNAPSKPEALRQYPLTRANLFPAEQNTVSRRRSTDDVHAHAEEQGPHPRNLQRAHDPENDSVYTEGSKSSGSSGEGNKPADQSNWDTGDIYAESSNDTHPLNEIIGLPGASSALQHGTSNMFAGIPIDSQRLTIYHLPLGPVKTYATTIQAICNALIANRPHIVTAILDVTQCPGSQARERILTAYNMIINDGKTHRLIIYAVMCWFWLHHEKSNMKAAFRSIAKDYLIAPDEETLTLLKKASCQGSTLNLLCPDHMIRTELFPGFLRLRLLPNQSMERFHEVVHNWYVLWTCFASFACQEDYGKPRLTHLEELLKKFDMFRGGHATPDEIAPHQFCTQKSIIELIALLHERFLQIDTFARSSQQEQRIPSTEVRKRTLLAAVSMSHPEVWARMESRSLNNDLDIDQMTYAELVAFVSSADCPRWERSAVVSYVNTMTKRSPSSPPPHGKKSQGPDSTSRPRPVFVSQNGYIYQCLTGPPVFASQEERQKAISEGKCGNCLFYRDRTYPPHVDKNCPFTLPSCKPRTGQGPFSPVAPLNNILHNASDAETVTAFIKEREQQFAKPPYAPNGGTSPWGAKGRKGGSQQVTVQQMQVRFDNNPEDVTEVVTTPEPPRVPPTLPPSPWNHSGSYVMHYFSVITTPPRYRIDELHQIMPEPAVPGTAAKAEENFIDTEHQTAEETVPNILTREHRQSEANLPVTRPDSAATQFFRAEGLDPGGEEAVIRVQLTDEKTLIEHRGVQLNAEKNSADEIQDTTAQKAETTTVQNAETTSSYEIQATAVNEDKTTGAIEEFKPRSVEPKVTPKEPTEIDTGPTVHKAQAEIEAAAAVLSIAKYTPQPASGNSTSNARRFSAVQLTHKVLDDDIKQASLHACETNHDCHTVARSLVPSDVYVPLGDLLSNQSMPDDVHIDIHLATPPCQPWLPFHPRPLGFDNDKATVFIACAKLHQSAWFINPHIQFLVDTVEPPTSISNDLERMHQLWNCQSMLLHAVKFDDYQWHCSTGGIPCIEASSSTIRHCTTNQPRFLHLNAAEVANGLPRHVTDGFDFSPDQRMRLIRHASNLWMWWSLLRNYRPRLSQQATTLRYITVFHSTVHTSPTSFPNTTEGSTAYAAVLNSLDDDALFSYFHWNFASPDQQSMCQFIPRGTHATISIHWKWWWTTFVDDIGIFGDSPHAIRIRSRILSILLDYLKKFFGILPTKALCHKPEFLNRFSTGAITANHFQ